LLAFFVCRENIPAPQEHVLTQEEIKLIADLRDPGVEDAFNLGLLQLRDALVEDLASRGPLPASIVEALELTPYARSSEFPIRVLDADFLLFTQPDLLPSLIRPLARTIIPTPFTTIIVLLIFSLKSA